jgi:hypothetical protein
MNKRYKDRIYEGDSHNSFEEANMHGRIGILYSELQWKELGHKRKLKGLTKGSTLQGVQG